MKRFLKRIWEGWKVIAHHIGLVVNTVLLVVLYFSVILVAGLIGHIVRWDPLRLRRPEADSYWQVRPQVRPDPERAQRLF